MDFATSFDRTPHRTKETFDNFDRSRRAPSRDLRFIATTSGSTVTFSIARHRHHRRRRMPGHGTSARKKRHHHHLRLFASPLLLRSTSNTSTKLEPAVRFRAPARSRERRWTFGFRRVELQRLVDSFFRSKETFAASSASSAT